LTQGVTVTGEFCLKTLFYVITSINDVTASKCLLTWKALIKSISKFDLWYTIFDPGINHEGQGRSAPKMYQLNGRPYATLYYHTRFGVDPIKNTAKIRVFVILMVWFIFDL
jgi:hypothetical protein